MLTRWTFVFATILTPFIAAAQPLADRVPADAMVYVGWNGSAHPGPGYAGSNLKAVLDDSGVAELVDSFLPKVFDKAEQFNPGAGEVAKIVSAIAMPSWKHPTAFFFAGIDMPAGGPPMPHLGIIWQPGADGQALADQLTSLTAQANAPFPVKVIHTADLVALMVGYDNPEAALGNPAAKSLITNVDFKAAFAHLSVAEPTFAAYVDHERLWGLVEQMRKLAADPQFDRIWPRLRDNLGLAGMKHLALASGFDGKDFGTQAFLEAPAPRAGLLELAGSKALDADILAAIPASATTAGAGRLDSGALFDLILKTTQDVEPNSTRMVDRFLQRVEQGSGVELRKDLLASLGDEWAYYADPQIGGRGLASLTIVNHLREPAKFEAAMSKVQDYALQQIQKEAGAEVPVKIGFDSVRIDGMTVHYLAVPIVSPSWVVSNGNLYVALFPQVAVGTARQVANKGPSILENPGFAAVQRRLGQPSPAAFGFMDLPKTAPDAYGTWLVISHLAGIGDLFGIKSPPMILPELNKLLTHLAPAGSVKWVDADGFHFRSIEPFPGSTLVASDPTTSMLYAEPLLVSIMLPALNKAREQANRVKSASNLRQIGMAAVLYANDHQDKLPKDLMSLASVSDLQGSVFINPRSENAAIPPTDPKQLGQWVTENSDYVWLGSGMMAGASRDKVIGYEKPDGLTDGINLLYGDFRVEFMPMEQAMQVIENSKQPAKVNGDL